MASYNDSDSDEYDLDNYEVSDCESDISVDLGRDIDRSFDPEDDEPLINFTNSRTNNSDPSSDFDDDDEPLINLTHPWTTNFTEKQIEEFTSETGPVLPEDFNTETASALDYFWLMFSPLMFELMARFTNMYARWKQTLNNKVDTIWRDTHAQEMRAFIGMNIYMGIFPSPNVRMYWSKDVFVGNKGLSDVMTCNRYGKLNSYFHVSDRETEPQRGSPNYDRLFKVRPIIDHVSSTFLNFYNLGRQLSIDEAMIRFTGKLSFRQYMPAKPIKRGIKIWMACDAETAYLSRFEVYLGRQEQTEHGLGYNVVRNLTDNIRNTNRHVYFDNFFTSVPLMKDLLGDGLYSNGTLRINRKFLPEEIKKPKNVKKRGDFLVMQKGTTEMIVTCWQDKKPVYNLSTLNSPTDIQDCTRRDGPELVALQQPAAVTSYNKYMGGVDRHDQLRAKYDVGRNSKKRWRYLFWFCINSAIVNAFIIFKSCTRRQNKKKRFSHLDFRMEIAKGLIAGYSSRKRKSSDSCDHSPSKDQENNDHEHVRLYEKKRRCIYHNTVLKERKETLYGCVLCNVPLCKNGCHHRFHLVNHGD